MRRQTGSRTTPVVRCIAYTRKSTDDGLDSDFNSLDAQREACEAYVTSQRHEGWLMLPEHYDDAGYTGANLDRPAMQQLIADIRAGKVEMILVYKIDRLSRSLLDFARLVEFFEQHKVSFTAITQNFNTASSLGRLTLNILLSFAQFERELVSERVRDKIAGAKRKGKFTGGTLVLGYEIDPVSHKLVVVPEEANTICRIFKRFAELASGQKVAKELNSDGITTKSRTNRFGIYRPGKEWNANGIYRVLSNRVYLGETKHHDKLYPGEHEAIVSQHLWDRAHAKLTHDGHQKRDKEESVPALLKGIIRCGCCDCSMFSVNTPRKGRLYRYYVCIKARKRGYDTCDVRSISAGEVELAVVDQLRALFRTPEMIARAVDEPNLAPALRTLDPISPDDFGVWEELFPAEQRRIVQLLVEQVTLYPGSIDIRYRTDGLHTLMAELNDTADTRSA